ncbi:hypothetical protein JK386_14645 [Nocardioides sp. zg-536]|uniref:DUF485 domain-containing protein n=1 Tax=Nocardioides faecalis TaxID=2803858 RepID=A0A938YAM1_9ACTN|nr:hypothetical protein [Nocardioides faecalis]MBM9461138.1 hypothetical protein [Nocardioides faecalis]MBS4752208.1 hypothetical protein [Nocardioides faecalis]QVI58993.1 hypothetical protein KG111_00900 [Nocardioides faecalis]
MTERVRVTGPPRHSTTARQASRLGDVHELNPVGDVYLRSLLREQLGLALRVVVLLVVTFGAVPLLFRLVPGLADVEVGGIGLAWLLLGGATYPFLLLLAWRYVRRAERNERVFADLVHGGRDHGGRDHESEP